MAKAKPAKTAAKSKKPAPAKSAGKPAAKAAKAVAKPVPAKKTLKLKLKPKGAAKAAPAKPAAPHKGANGTAAPKAPVVKVKLTPFLEKQRERLLILKDTLLDSMNGVARDSLRSQTGGDASAFGMHQADAGSDAYDRDFALSLLSQEQDSLYEIDQALKRIHDGNYGVCEVSGKPIIKARLEALPFTRYTVECQAEIEKRNRYQRNRQPVTSLFGLGEDEDSEEESEASDSKE
jgi:DnaK suppressor protein